MAELDEETHVVAWTWLEIGWIRVSKREEIWIFEQLAIYSFDLQKKEIFCGLKIKFLCVRYFKTKLINFCNLIFLSIFVH